MQSQFSILAVRHSAQANIATILLLFKEVFSVHFRTV